MGKGLQRARAAAKASRTAKCSVCGKPMTLRVNAMQARIPLHGPKDSRCPGSGEKPKET